MIVLAGDYDIRDDEKPNVGLDAATAAAKAIGGVLAMPEFDGKKCDFNDIHMQRGLDAVTQAIEAAIRREEMRTMNTATAISDTHTDPWPQLDEAALHGLCGDVVKILEPHTEADRVALLVSFLSEAAPC